MHTRFIGRLGLPLYFLTLWLAGCQSTPNTPQIVRHPPKVSSPQLIWPASGELNFASACHDDCIPLRLSLSRDHLFRWQRLGAGQQQDDTGRWQRSGDTLTLTGQGSKALQLTLSADNSLSFQQQPLAASQLSLFATPAVMLGELISKDDSLWLAPCATGQHWPLVNNGQYRLLQRLYAKSVSEHQGDRRVLAKLHWTDDRQSLTMDRFLSLGPGQCDSP